MKTFIDRLFWRHSHTCPWWLCFAFDNAFRRFFQNPEQILRPYVAEDMTVLDIGPGMGYFSIPLARMVGPKGRVIAADIQPEMLRVLQRKAKREALHQRIVPHLCKSDSLDLQTKVDFALAFWMVHEVPDPFTFFREMRFVLKPSGKMLMAEPTIHVTRRMYIKTIQEAESVGFRVAGNPKIFMSRSSLLELG
ncbi:MAG: class I SAM-dependent methyltransferase [Pseudomonadota bacterium]